MAVITLTEAKTLLQITSTSYDALITALIPIIESDIREYCNQNFQDAPAEPSWSPWMKLPASKMIGFNLDPDTAKGMKSESQGEYSYTREIGAHGYPLGIMSAFDKVKVGRLGFGQKFGQFRDGRGMTVQELVKTGPLPGDPDGEPKYED